MFIILLFTIHGTEVVYMRAKCPKCGAVFEYPWHPTLVHVGSIKLLKCPACGKRGMMSTGVKDPANWPKEEGQKGKEGDLNEKEELERRIQESKYELPIIELMGILFGPSTYLLRYRSQCQGSSPPILSSSCPRIVSNPVGTLSN